MKKYYDLNLVAPKIPFDAVAIIEYMPLTTVTETVNECIDDVLTFRLPNSLWERRADETLTLNQK